MESFFVVVSELYSTLDRPKRPLTPFLDYHNLRFATRCIRRVLVSVVVAYTSEIRIPFLDELCLIPITFRATLAKGDKYIVKLNNRRLSKGADRMNHEASTTN